MSGLKPRHSRPRSASNVPLTIQTTRLPDGAVDAPYSSRLVAANGTSPYSWAVSAQIPGVVVAAEGSLSGTPTAAGSYPVESIVTDSRGATVTRQYTVRVAGSLPPIPQGGTPPTPVPPPVQCSYGCAVAWGDPT